MELKLENITNLIKALSWTKIAQMAAFLLLVGLAYGAWENRVVIYNSIKVVPQYSSPDALILELGKDTASYIDTTTTKTAHLIAGIQIISVDFKKNSRETSHFSITDERLRKAWDRYLQNKISQVPLFGNNESHNQHVIDLINGNFICIPFDRSVAAVYLGDSGLSINTVCSISIPPYYGRFSGYMNIYVKNKLTDADAMLMRQISRQIALQIFEIDIKKGRRYVEE